jgi:hypothetical protein
MVTRVTESDSAKRTWDAMRDEERRERDEHVAEDIEQTERISKSLAAEESAE